MLSLCLNWAVKIGENNKATCFSCLEKQVAIVWNKWLKLLLSKKACRDLRNAIILCFPYTYNDVRRLSFNGETCYRLGILRNQDHIFSSKISRDFKCSTCSSCLLLTNPSGNTVPRISAPVKLQQLREAFMNEA